MNLLLLMSVILPLDGVIPLVSVSPNQQMSINYDSFEHQSKIFQITPSGAVTFTEELKDRPVSPLIAGNGSWYFLGVSKTFYRVGTNGKIMASVSLKEGLSAWTSPWVSTDGKVWIGSKDSSFIYIHQFDETLKTEISTIKKPGFDVYQPLGVSPSGEVIVPIRNSFVSDEEWDWVDSAGMISRELKLPCLAKNPILDFSNSRAFFVCDLAAKVVSIDLGSGEVLHQFQTDRTFSSWTPGLSYDAVSDLLTVTGRWSDGQIYFLDSNLTLKLKKKFGDGVQSFYSMLSGSSWSWVYSYSSLGVVPRLLELDSAMGVLNEMSFSGTTVTDLGTGLQNEQWFLSSSPSANKLCRAVGGTAAPDCVDVAIGLNGDESSRTDLGSGKSLFTFWSGNSSSAMIYLVE